MVTTKACLSEGKDERERREVDTKLVQNKEKLKRRKMG